MEATGSVRHGNGGGGPPGQVVRTLAPSGACMEGEGCRLPSESQFCRISRGHFIKKTVTGPVQGTWHFVNHGVESPHDVRGVAVVLGFDPKQWLGRVLTQVKMVLLH